MFWTIVICFSSYVVLFDTTATLLLSSLFYLFLFFSVSFSFFFISFSYRKYSFVVRSKNWSCCSIVCCYATGPRYCDGVMRTPPLFSCWNRNLWNRSAYVCYLPILPRIFFSSFYIHLLIYTTRYILLYHLHRIEYICYRPFPIPIPIKSNKNSHRCIRRSIESPFLILYLITFVRIGVI